MTIRAPHLRDVFASRRSLLGGLAGLPLIHLAGCASSHRSAPQQGAALGFTSVPATTADTITVPEGYRWRTLIAWGDALFEDMARFDPDALTRAEQENRFGASNDMLAHFPPQFVFPPPTDSDRLILCVNNEELRIELMFPRVRRMSEFTPAQIEAAFASLGVTVLDLEREDGEWRVVKGAAPGCGHNRRITPFTPVIFTGPAANHPWILEAARIVNATEPGPEGSVRCGTLANCAGGQTPWGTYLTAEENFQAYFFGVRAVRDAAYAQDAASQRYPNPGAPDALLPPAFRYSENPTGPALYGWIVEIDPYDPGATPRKRTALGRKKNECANTALTADGRVAVYMGDDQANEHVYKFVTRGRFDPHNRAANMDLLDEGQLYCARFEADGTGSWIALTLEAANAAAAAQGEPAFADAGDLAMRVRAAAALLGATPMDRPEDVEAVRDGRWRGLGPVLIACTKSDAREGAAPANPRRSGDEAAPRFNHAGHIIRLDEADGDCGAERFSWDIFAMGGDPDAEMTRLRNGEQGAVGVDFNGAPTISGARFACPDNIFIDADHRIWVATDGNEAVFADCNDQIVAAPLEAEGPRPMKRFLVGPVGAEICGPLMAPDERAFFCSIQHPGEADRAGRVFSRSRWEGAACPSTFPDGGWPRHAVIVVTRDDGGRIGD